MQATRAPTDFSNTQEHDVCALYLKCFKGHLWRAARQTHLVKLSYVAIKNSLFL